VYIFQSRTLDREAFLRKTLVKLDVPLFVSLCMLLAYSKTHKT